MLAPISTCARRDSGHRTRVDDSGDIGPRINGQWFAFVAEPGEGGKGLVARQRAVQLGPVVDQNYTVISGLKPGEKLIAAGIQKIRDGAPVQASPAKGGA